MNAYQKYKSIITKFSYREENIRKILRIFDGTGESQIITSEIIPSSFRIKEFLILSKDMERALNIIHKKLREIQEENEISTANLFYFTQYGGSKTQFLNLVINEVNNEFPDCICVLLEDLSQIHPVIIFEKIFNQILNSISKNPKFTDDQKKFHDFSNRLRQHIGEIQVAIQQSSNLKIAEDILSDLMKIRNPEVKRKINQLDILLHSTILIDSTGILNKIIQLMQFCTQNSIVFLLLFDEVDLWLDDQSNDLKFSKNFNKISKFMKVLLEIPDNKIKILNIFACTDRVNRLFQTRQHIVEGRSSVISRFNRIFNNAEKILEPGNYGSKIEEALVCLAAYYHLANARFKIDNKFFEHVIPALELLYKPYSRRLANSKIIKLLNYYNTLSEPLEVGLKNWYKDTLRYGKLIEGNLSSVLKYLTINFIRKDILVDPSTVLSRNKIDGYFINYNIKNEEIKTFVEIKLTGKFKGEKASQALQWLQLHQRDHIVMIIFSPTPLEEIKQEIIRYSQLQGFENQLYERLFYIHIDNSFAFAPIIGISNIGSDFNKTTEFLEAFAHWLDFFGGFSSQYQQIKSELGIDFILKEEKKEGEEKKGKEEEEIKLSQDQQIILNLLSAMCHHRRFSKTGRMNKGTIQNFIVEKSLGITDTEKYYEIMDRNNIVETNTNKQVLFSKKIIDAPTIEELQIVVNSYFKGIERSFGLLDQYS